MRKRSLRCGRMHAGARRRRAHESRQCDPRRISCSITSWRAAQYGRAESPAHTRPPRGRSERQRRSGAAPRSAPAAKWRSASPTALRRTWGRSPSGRRVPRSRWSGEAGSACPTKAS